MLSEVMRVFVRVRPLSASYGFGKPSLLKIVWMASATTAQLFSRSSAIFSSFRTSLDKPRVIDFMAMTVCAAGIPMFLETVESVRSRCNLEMGSFEERCSKSAFAIPRFPSAFSKSMGLTLCGIADDPTSPALIFCLK